VGATTPVEKEQIDKGIQKEIIRLKVQVSNKNTQYRARSTGIG